jgi:IMP dehydrogenase
MIREGLTFDDVLLSPRYSTIESRSKIDISVSLKDFEFEHPIIPANMKTITGSEMAFEIINSGGLAILHRFMSIEEQIDVAEDMIDMGGGNRFAISIGVKDKDKDTLAKFADVGVQIVCIDIAHGDSKHCAEMTSWIKDKYPKMLVIAGNVATGEGAARLWRAGADVVKVGVGPGSLCTTRIETGNGVPQLTALMDVAEAQKQMQSLYQAKREHRTFPFISDGGIKSAGDVVKALAISDMVMVGNIFAGCEETPGSITTINGHPHKEYVGSSTHKANHIEGVSAWVPYKGKFKDVLSKLLEGLRSGCSYQGADNLTQLKNNPAFIKITNAGLKESHPHDVILR